MIVYGSNVRRGDVPPPHLWHILGMVLIVGDHGFPPDPEDATMAVLPETWEFLGLDGNFLDRENGG
jgi:hypothetical protein